MKTLLDWSAYEDAGMGDAYADIPKTGGDFAKAVAVCINSQACESLNEKGLMCPSFRATQQKNLSTGGRVKLLKAALNGELGPKPFSDPVLQEAMDLCVSCKGCKRECENSVDMALIKVEYLAQRNQLEGISWRGWLFAHLPRLLARGQHLRLFIHWRNRSKFLASLGQKFLGLAADRLWPVPAATPFQPKSPATKPDQTAREVVLLVDTFTRYFHPDAAEAAIAVLEAAGLTVIVALPPQDERPLCCGRTYLAQGEITRAQAEAKRMLEALLPHAVANRPIIGLEPSCLLTLRDEYKAMNLGEAALKVAPLAFLFEEYLAKEMTAKTLNLKLKPVANKVLIHGHCHQKAVGAMKSVRKILKLIPDLNFELVESSCCGMAGSFGLEAEHAELAQQMAELALLPKLRSEPDSLVVSNGFSCRHQILQCENRGSLHLAQLFRDALV